MKEISYIGLGSNVGDRIENLERAIMLIGEAPSIKVQKTSPFYETGPMPPADPKNAAPFINCVIEIETSLDPYALLKLCNDIEEKMGRSRKREKGAPRTIDLDILFYGNKVIDEKVLKIPHPEVQKRTFVLVPLCDIAPMFKDPLTGRTILELKKQCGGESHETIHRYR